MSTYGPPEDQLNEQLVADRDPDYPDQPRRCHRLQAKGNIVVLCSQILIGSTCPIHGYRPLDSAR